MLELLFIQSSQVVLRRAQFHQAKTAAAELGGILHVALAIRLMTDAHVVGVGRAIATLGQQVLIHHYDHDLTANLLLGGEVGEVEGLIERILKETQVHCHYALLTQNVHQMLYFLEDVT